MKIGPFYFDTKEIFLFIAIILLGIAIYFNWDIYFFDRTKLLTIVVIVLIAKGLLPAIHNEPFFILSLIAIFLTLFLPIFQVLLFFFLAFILFKLLRVI